MMTNGTNPKAALDTSYEFFPSVRRGYRPAADRAFESGAASLKGRTEFGVALTVEGQQPDAETWETAETQPSVDIRMYGPGDVTGIDERQVVRVEPEPETTTFPPNYFPLVEFARPDLPWLFSPERANPSKGGKHRPWLCLAVVEADGDDVSFEAAGTRPLPTVTAPVTQLPPVGECWAWAHVQVVGELSERQLERAFTTRSSQSVARLLCPRNLDPNTRYRACLVPTFEPGRRVGLGKAPFETSGGSDAPPPTVDLAWPTRNGASDGATVTLPVYHRWSFTTGDKGDFESLARKLTPRELDDYGVGSRTVNLSDPGPVDLKEGSGLTREVGGALQSPGLSAAPYPETSGGEDRQKRATLRRLLNDPGSEVPVVGPPIYGRWYLPSKAGWTLSDQRVPQPPDVPTGGDFFDAWFHELNVDPLHRIPAGYGTAVVQENQEELMAVAWEQFGDLELANERVGRAQLGDVVGGNATDRFDGLGDDVVGYGSRVRDIEELHREILAAGRLRDEGILDRDPLSDGPATDPDEGYTDPGTVDYGGVDAGLGSAGGDAGTRFTGGVGGDGVAGQVVELQSEETTAAAAGDLLTGDGTGLTDGGVATTDETTAAARLVQAASPAFRSATRRGGKLDRGQEGDTAGDQRVSDRLQSEPRTDSRTNLGSRFSRVSDALPTVESVEGDAATTEDAPDTEADVEATPDPASDTDTVFPDWRLGPDGQPLALGAALEHLDDERTVLPKALLQVESVHDHCDSAREQLGRLDDRLREAATSETETAREAGETETGAESTEPPSLLALVTEEPTVADYCEAIERNTFETLGRQLSKLVAVAPDALDPAFTDRRKNELVGELRAAHSRLVEIVGEVSEQIRIAETDGEGGGPADGEAGAPAHGAERESEEGTPAEPREPTGPAALRGQVTEATRAIDDIEATLAEIEQYIDGAVAPTQPLSAEAEVNAELPESSTAPVGPVPSPALTEPTRIRTPPVDGQVASMRTQLLSGTTELPGLLDASEWTKQRAAWNIHPGIRSREVELGRIMAAPEFDRPAYEPLKTLDEEYLLPGVSDIPKNTIGVLETNQQFIESYLCGLNHEFGRELLWRRYPTDRRATYFRQFWDYTKGNEQYDVGKLHEWRDSELGGNGPGDTASTPENLAVLVVRGELLRAYHNTRVYAVKAVKEDTDESAATNWDRVPLLERRRQAALAERRDPQQAVETFRAYDEAQLEGWTPKEPIFRGTLDPDITFLGFDLGSAAAEGETIDEGGEKTDLGWFFVLEEPVGETRFGLDVASPGDFASAERGPEPYGMPFGLSHGPPDANGDRSVKRMDATAYNGDSEAGWSGLSWGHLVGAESQLDAKTHVRVGDDRPAGGGDPAWAVADGQRWTMTDSQQQNEGREPGADAPPEERWAADNAATWGLNSAHMARTTWQLPARVCIHADDMMPDVSGDGLVHVEPMLTSDVALAATEESSGGDDS
ncbi:hypothetical protein DP107_16860 [Haloglomus irregulare]|jgi:hypothetical protein|uniref:Uncharacterized protein n=1 Tax=Haloglomus irregulare TaxID=2234134 RepID=A0A554MVN4_9EURY|nr:hypothetical protein [Haloglomus irregulare]TSD09196.1 hypothetical protein DP107_16860 [Haloglomus irregulare]